MENFLDKGPNPSLQVVDENSNWQTGNTADIKRQRNLSHSSEFESEGLKLITYSRRSSKAGHMRKKKNQNTSQENLQKNISHNKKSSIMKPAETCFWRKKYNDTSFGESSSGVDGKEDGPMRARRQADRASTVSTDSDQNKANFLDSKTNKCARRRRMKRRNRTSSNARQVSVSKQGVNVSMESENIDSVKNDDLHPEILSKPHMKTGNNINQRMSVKQDSSKMQINSSVIAENKRDLHCSPGHSLKISALKTYSRRCNNAGQQGKGPHRSYLNSWDNKNDLCNGSSSIIDASETDCKRLENDSASFNESPLNAEKDGGSSLNTQTSPSDLTHSDINFNFHEVNIMDLGGMKKARGRRKEKNKTPVCNNPLPISEKDMSVSVNLESIEVEKTGMDSDICSKSKIGNIKSSSGSTYTRKKERAKMEMEMATVNKNGSLDNAQLCNVFPKMLKPENGYFCQWKGEILVGEMSNGTDGERCPHSSVQGVTKDIISDTTMKENITFDNMAVPLQSPLINDGKKKLLILDLNGLLVDVLYERHPIQRPPIRVSGKSVYKRPFCEHFLEFCFERFNVGVWSSRQRKNIDVVVNFLFGEKRSRLLFVWDLSKCTPTGFNTLENKDKPLVLKELKKLWNKEDEDLPWEKGDYSPSNTLLIDDSPYKALCNPPHTAIFPIPYDYRNEKDHALAGLEGDLRIYLERLAMADNVQNYVEEHPFGQHAIMPENASWRFYLQIIEKMETSFTSASSF